jgi:hypothetical protein
MLDTRAARSSKRIHTQRSVKKLDPHARRVVPTFESVAIHNQRPKPARCVGAAFVVYTDRTIGPRLCAASRGPASSFLSRRVQRSPRVLFQFKEKTMKRSVISALSLALVVTLALAARADNPNDAKKPADGPAATVYDADSAFEFLKTLAGDWARGEDDSDASSSKFRISGAGSTVIETIFPGQPSEMVTVYHRDGDDLLLTHYCALWNAPVMKFEKCDKPGEIKFAFHGGTNFDPDVDTYVHHGTLQIKDADTLEVNFVAFADGKPQPENRSILKRKAAQ